jgi:hypothetical protein
MAQAAAGGGAASALQNPKVQIGIIAGGVVVLLVVIWLLFFNKPPETSTVPSASAGQLGLANGPTDATAMASGGLGGAPSPGVPAGFGGATFGAPGGQPGGAAAPTEAPQNQTPGVATRANPFAPNSDIRQVLDSIPTVDPDLAFPHDIYQNELYKPPLPVTPGDDDQGGPPVPAMRVAGIVQGTDQLSAMLQMGDAFLHVTPGNMIPEHNPIYRVERIEPDKVILTRRWEVGTRKGTQRIEVALAHGQVSTPMMPGAGGFPGAGGNGGGGGTNGPGGPGAR